MTSTSFFNRPFAIRAAATRARCRSSARVPWHIACTIIPVKPASPLTAVHPATASWPGASRGRCTSYSTVQFEKDLSNERRPCVQTLWLPSLARRCNVGLAPATASAETLEIGIGTQNTTTNTVTGGVVLKELGLLEKHLPKTGKYKDFQYKLSWQNATSGPPITNGMMANNIQIGMMGDYPLMVNGATGQATKNETQLVAIIAYNAVGGGNGIVVHKDSPFYELADLKGKNVSVPFGSAAHGMMLTSLQKRDCRPTSGIWCRSRRKSAPPICRKSASMRMATSCRSPSCCRSRVLPARSMTAPRPRPRHSMASSCARILARNIRRSWWPTSTR